MLVLRFIGSRQGRVARVLVGVLLIAFGIKGEGKRQALVVVGIVPFAAGAFDICLLGPLFRLPIRGKTFRARSATT